MTRNIAQHRAWPATCVLFLNSELPIYLLFCKGLVQTYIQAEPASGYCNSLTLPQIHPRRHVCPVPTVLGEAPLVTRNRLADDRQARANVSCWVAMLLHGAIFMTFGDIT